MLWQTISSVFATFILYWIVVWLRRVIREWNTVRGLPTPPGAHWLLGHLSQNPFGTGLQWQRDVVKDFPRVYTYWTGLNPLPMMVHPETVKPVLANSVQIEKDFFLYDAFQEWIGEGLFIANGAKWKRNRRLLTRSFHLDVLRTYTPISNDCVEVLLEKMDKVAATGKPFMVYRELALCTFDVILRSACSYKSNCQLTDLKKKDKFDVLSAWEDTIWFVNERIIGGPTFTIPWLFRLGPHYSRFKRSIAFVDNFAKEIIKQRQREIAEKIKKGDPITKPRDFLDTIVMARDDDGSGLTDRELVDELDTFLFAGHETTATSLTWLLYNLAKYTEHQTKIREEVDAILDGRESERIEFKDLKRLQYMSVVMKESMRMINAAAIIGRRLNAPLTVEGVTLPAGTPVGVNIYQLHHNPTVWGNDHMEFKPSRFLKENLEKVDPFAFIPFSAGARNCIGQQFGLNEMKVFVARILRRFRLSLNDGDPEPSPKFTIVLKPDSEVRLIIEPIKRDA